MDRALLVGINQYPAAPLRGCVNDITDMADFLVNECNFAKSDIRLLVDGRATTTAILDHLNWLVDGVNPGDRIFFQYSGHGTQMATRDHQGEIDGLDEVICPVDFDWTDPHVIRDKDFRRIFSAIPQNCEFIWVSDSCHSYDLSREIPPTDILWKTFPIPVDIQWRNDTANILTLNALTLKAIPTLSNNVALISGCRSDQTSADSIFNNRPNGALTHFLLKALSDVDGRTLPLDALIEKVKDELHQTQKFTQIPGVEGSPDIIKKPFLIKF